MQFAHRAGTWVVIPAQNESASVAQVVGRSLPFAEHVVVVDDASVDLTAEIAAGAGATVLSLVSSLDAWGASQTGLRYAHARGAKRVVTLDADGQHSPEAIPALVDGVLFGGADVSIGSDPARVSRSRYAAWRYLRALTGLSVADLTSGFRVYGAKALDLLIQEKASALNYQDIGVLLMLREGGLTVKEIPVSMSPRLFGASHVFRSWIKVLAYMLESTVIGIARRRRI